MKTVSYTVFICYFRRKQS